MQLVRSLFFFTAHFNMALWPEHIAGVTNIAADGLSRDNRETFFAQVPYALATPSRLPQELVDLLLLSRPDWITKLEQRVQHYFAKGLADSTLRTYTSAHKRYLRFCVAGSMIAIPATEQVLCCFVVQAG